MTSKKENQSASDSHNPVVGALVADAAAMGLHWLYDQEQIARIATTGDVIFRAPDTSVYDGHKGYFAHAGRLAGELSHYGEALMLFADLLTTEQSYSVAAHRQLFLERFGPGGSFRGYADRPTKALVARILEEGDDLPARSGSDDDQLPAVIPVSAFFQAGCSADDLQKAVLVSADNPVALEGAMAVFTCLQSLDSGMDMSGALHAGVEQTTGNLKDLLSQALEIPDYEPLSAANQFGMPCHIPQGLPVVWHMLNCCGNFETLIRDNVRCGGDSCGRAMALGPIAATAFGMPKQLIVRLSDKTLLSRIPAKIS